MAFAVVAGFLAGFVLLLLIGRKVQVLSAQGRVALWARSGGFTIERCERASVLTTRFEPTWRVRIVDSAGERREAWVRSAGFVRRPVDVLWAAPGTSVFR